MAQLPLHPSHNGLLTVLPLLGYAAWETFLQFCDSDEEEDMSHLPGYDSDDSLEETFDLLDFYDSCRTHDMDSRIAMSNIFFLTAYFGYESENEARIDYLFRCIQTPEWYIRPRSTEWSQAMQHFVARQDPLQWIPLFRVSVKFWSTLVVLLEPSLATHTPYSFTGIRNRVIGVPTMVLISLFKLGTGMTYLALSAHFGLGVNIVSHIVHKFTVAVTTELGHFVNMPRRGRQLQAAIDENMAVRGFPNCVGAIDVSHIEIQVPNLGEPKAFWDRNHNFSICLQAVVGQNALFYDVAVGAVGSMHDMRILKRSWIRKKNMGGRRLFRGPAVMHNGTRIPPYIIGDGGYSLVHWLISPFRNSTAHPLTDAQKRFNTALSSTRMVVERAFGMLKSVWRMFGGRVNHPSSQGRLERQIRTCCVLHNMQIVLNEGPVADEEGEDGHRLQVLPEVLAEDEEAPPEDPHDVHEGGNDEDEDEDVDVAVEDEAAGSAIREALFDYLGFEALE